MTPIANAMRDIGSRMEALGRDQLRFGQRRYDETLPLYQQMVQANLEGQRMSMQLARDSNADRQKFRALEDQMVSEAASQDRGALRAEYAGRAASDAEQASAATRAIAVRNLSRMGINPNAARFADLNNQLAMSGAATRTGAMNNARMAADATVDARRMNAISLGRNLPATQLSAIGTASGVGNSNAGLFNSQNAPVFQGYGGAMAGLQGNLGAQSGMANVMNMGYQNALAADQASNAGFSALGSLAGAGLSFFSSRDMKEGKSPVKSGEGLEAVRALPVDRWNYKGDGREHVGTYAEDFRRETGVGDGKTISVQDAIGVTMAAIKDLDQKVELLAGKPRKMANGGSVEGGKNRDGSGGKIRGAGTGTSDSVKALNRDTGEPIMLSNGEYILPADTVRRVGKQALDTLVERTHKPVRSSAIRRS
jgi:hypothetical protein